MDITIILCTYNRCESLAKALDSVVRSVLPDSVQWEVLVIDNNSNDRTQSVVEEYTRKHPSRVRYQFERRQGKSYALNSGIRAARGDVLAFTDDDVEVDHKWLANLTAPLSNRKWAGVGGRVLPEVGFVPATWMNVKSRDGLAPLAIFDLGPGAGQLQEAPFGNNMAFHREMFKNHGDFRVDLGPQPGSEIRSEDSEFGCRLLAAGELLWYEPSAIVFHSIPKERTRREYFQVWWFDKGRADIRQLGVPEDTKWYIAGVPLHLFRRLARWTLQWAITIHEPKRFVSKCNVWYVAGNIVECYQQARRV
jgi:glucosyl-dolichyl phosphate glucuronosyltransferase